jgi:hypothetical protein
MSDINSEYKPEPKIESLKATATEFISKEKETISQLGGKVLHDVESLLNDSVQGATSRLNSLFKRVETVIRTEPLVALTALAITGIAIVNLMRKRQTSPSAPKRSTAGSTAGETTEESHFH